MRITYLSSAIADLTEIRDYIATHYPNIAQPIGTQIRDSLNRLAQFPNLGKPGRVFGTRELITPKVGKSTYIAIYRVLSDEVQILRVLAGTRDIDTLLAEGLEDLEN